MNHTKLTPEQRAKVLRLVREEGLSRHVVAERFGVGLETVRHVLRPPRKAPR